MDKFGFIIHITDSELMARAFNEPGLDFKISKPIYQKRVVERSLRWFPPFKCADITGLKSITGKEIEGFFIFCPLIPEQILNMSQEFVLRRVVESCDLAAELGAKIVGLGAYMSQVGRKGILVAKKTKIPVTTGLNYTIAIAADSILKAAFDLDLDVRKAKIAIIGATGGIGNICSKIITPYCNKAVLVARNKTRLDKLADSIKDECGKDVEVDTNINKAIQDADIVIFATNDPSTLIKSTDIKKGAIICDMSIPKNVSEEIVNSRKDILVIDGGIVKPPGNVDFNFYFGPPLGRAYACIAETMILTLEERFESFSIGDNISIDKVLEIRKLGQKHGFTISEFRSFYGEITAERLKTIKEAIKNRFVGTKNET